MINKKFDFLEKMKFVLLAALIIAVLGTVIGLIFGVAWQPGHTGTLRSDGIFSFGLKCLYAAVILAVVMLVYMWIRFGKIGWFKAFVSLMVTCIISTAMPVFIYMITRMKISDSIFAMMAMVFCYTCFNVILIFERYREKKGADENVSPANMMNLSINEVGRPLFLSSAVICFAMLCVIIISLIAGANGVVYYMLPMLISTVMAFALSVCVAGPMLVAMSGKKGGKKSSKATPKKKKAII